MQEGPGKGARAAQLPEELHAVGKLQVDWSGPLELEVLHRARTASSDLSSIRVNLGLL